jgi:hypothetical protein
MLLSKFIESRIKQFFSNLSYFFFSKIVAQLFLFSFFPDNYLCLSLMLLKSDTLQTRLNKSDNPDGKKPTILNNSA